MTLHSNYESFFVNSVWGNSLSDEGIAALEMMKDEMNSKRGPDEHNLSFRTFCLDEFDFI